MWGGAAARKRKQLVTERSLVQIRPVQLLFRGIKNPDVLTAFAGVPPIFALPGHMNALGHVPGHERG